MSSAHPRPELPEFLLSLLIETTLTSIITMQRLTPAEAEAELLRSPALVFSVNGGCARCGTHPVVGSVALQVTPTPEVQARLGLALPESASARIGQFLFCHDHPDLKMDTIERCLHGMPQNGMPQGEVQLLRLGDAPRLTSSGGLNA